VSAPKKKYCHVFRNPLRPIPNLTPSTSSPADRESISVANLLNPLRNKRVMKETVNVSNVRERGGQEGGKERVTLRSSFKVVV
jgi:hypothetical protein